MSIKLPEALAHAQRWVTKDKSTWGDGPWQDEPDKVQWIDPETGLDCLMVRPHGAWCGYVGVPPEHPLHGKQADDMEVHGGITYDGALCQETDDPSHGICHVPAPGRPADVWWFGFDTAHAGDMDPQRSVYYKNAGFDPILMSDHETYRDMEYVIGQVQLLAMQLKDVG